MVRWYVIRSKYRNEDLLCHQLHCRNIEVYYPYTCNRKSKSTRKVKPYFPGYLFVHVDLDITPTSDLCWIPGAMGLVRFGGEAACVSDLVIQTIRTRVAQLNASREFKRNGLQTGDAITVTSGPLSGLCGVFDLYLSGRERVLVLLNFLRDQQVRVELPVGQINATKSISA